MIQNQNFAKNSALYFISMIFPKLLGFIALPIFTRYLLPEEIGIYAYTLGITGVLVVLSSLGLNAFYLRNYALVDDSKNLNGTIFWFMIIWNVILFLIALVAIYLFFVFSQISIPFFPYMFLALVIHLLHSTEIIPMRTFRIRGEVKYYLMRTITKSSISVFTGLALVVFFDYGIMGRYYAELLSSLIFAFIFILYMKRHSYLKIDKLLLKRALKFSIPIVPSDLLQTSTPMINNLIIVRFLSLAQLGIYSVANTLASIVQLITSSIFLSIEPILYLKAKENDFPKFLKNVKDLVFVLSLLFSFGFALFIREVIIIFLGDNYQDAWTIVQILAVSYSIVVLRGILVQLVIVQGKTNKLFIGNLVNLVVMFIVGLIAIPRWGSAALGFTNLIGFSFAILALYIVIDKDDYKLHLVKDFFSLVLIILLIFISRLIPIDSMGLSILIKFGVFFTTGFIILALYSFSPKRLISIVKSVITKN
ncbi:MAG: oligosaccharide flippase family protein [Candidatus Izemoplasmataceae bacterium]